MLTQINQTGRIPAVPLLTWCRLWLIFFTLLSLCSSCCCGSGCFVPTSHCEIGAVTSAPPTSAAHHQPVPQAPLGNVSWFTVSLHATDRAMASLNLSINGPSIKSSYQGVINAAGSSPSSTYASWALFSVQAPLANAFQDSGNKESVLKVQTTGEGELDELIEDFNEGRIQFAFLKVKDPNTGLPKYALIAWVSSRSLSHLPSCHLRGHSADCAFM